jgi:2-polyprenyl-3-methyl-5-hydroxy-6-metoxy-1,4-benzoquinol methylase
MDIFQKYVNKNAHILNIGCGYGYSRILNELYDSGYNTVGIDFSEKMIEREKLYILIYVLKQ